MTKEAENALRLARRVLDYEAETLREFYELARPGDPLTANLYARQFNNLVDLREKLTEEGVTNMADWMGPEATKKIVID